MLSQQLSEIEKNFELHSVMSVFDDPDGRDELEEMFWELKNPETLIEKPQLNNYYLKELSATSEVNALELLNAEDPEEDQFSVVCSETFDHQDRALTDSDYTYLAAYSDPEKTELIGYLVVGRNLLYEELKQEIPDEMTLGITIEAVYTKPSMRGRGVATYLACAFLFAVARDIEKLDKQIPRMSRYSERHSFTEELLGIKKY